MRFSPILRSVAASGAVRIAVPVVTLGGIVAVTIVSAATPGGAPVPAAVSDAVVQPDATITLTGAELASWVVAREARAAHASRGGPRPARPSVIPTRSPAVTSPATAGTTTGASTTAKAATKAPATTKAATTKRATASSAAARLRTSPNAARATARAMVSARGWGSSQYSCLVSLWEKESNWNHRASNPSSGAYGIPQALPGSKMVSAGSDWRTNPATQIAWGLGYIADRYGTPCAAWSHSRAVNWY